MEKWPLHYSEILLEKKKEKKKAQTLSLHTFLTFPIFSSQDSQKQQKVILLLKAALCPERGTVPKDQKDSFAFIEFHCVYGFCAEGQLWLHRTALCLWVLCRRTALPSQDCTVFMGYVQKDSFALTGLHCVHGFCAEGQFCLQRVSLYQWLLCRRTALPSQNCIVSMGSAQTGSFAFVGLHCVYGFCAEGQLCLCRIALCPRVLCRRTALPSESFTVSVVTVQKDSFAFVGLHCVYGFCAEGQLCLHRTALCPWVLCRRTALPL